MGLFGWWWNDNGGVDKVGKVTMLFILPRAFNCSNFGCSIILDKMRAIARKI